MTDEDLKILNEATKVRHDIADLEDAVKEIENYMDRDKSLSDNEPNVARIRFYASDKYLEVECLGPEERQIVTRMLTEYKTGLEKKLSDLRNKFAAMKV